MGVPLPVLRSTPAEARAASRWRVPHLGGVMSRPICAAARRSFTFLQISCRVVAPSHHESVESTRSRSLRSSMFTVLVNNMGPTNRPQQVVPVRPHGVEPNRQVPRWRNTRVGFGARAPTPGGLRARLYGRHSVLLNLPFSRRRWTPIRQAREAASAKVGAARRPANTICTIGVSYHPTKVGIGREKVTGTLCLKCPSGASHKRCLSPFPFSQSLNRPRTYTPRLRGACHVRGEV